MWHVKPKPLPQECKQRAEVLECGLAVGMLHGRYAECKRTDPQQGQFDFRMAR
jgi:hypothetical protein